MKIPSSIAIASVCLSFSSASANITYEGTEGAGKGKHIVFIASDHEYRAEQTSPALARILAKHHGFKCTVLFGTDKDGFIQPGASNIEGLEALESADSVFVFARFLNLPEEQMSKFAGYLEKGGPLVGVRTSSHAFSKIPATSKYAKFNFNNKSDDMKGGFGQHYLGNSWEGHYGTNHVQLTRMDIIPEKKEHPILRGVESPGFCLAGGYGSVIRENMEPLTMSQPLVSYEKTSENDPARGPKESSWTYHYTTTDGKKHRVFHSTQGASEDILDDSYRRLLINALFWSVGLEEGIKADNNIAFVGPYHPTIFATGEGLKNQKPSDMEGFETPIGAKSKEEANNVEARAAYLVKKAARKKGKKSK